MKMISAAEAQDKIIRTVLRGKEISVALGESPGHILSRNIFSPLDLPSFHNSAMDGYAIITQDIIHGIPITISGESSAGKSFRGKIKSGQAIRIFTGAEVPPGADAVVMQEKTALKNGLLMVHDATISPGLNIRRKGSQIKKKELALAEGTLITPAGAGFIASMGVNKISVYQKPVVSVIITGNELQKAGTKLKAGKIFESNSAALLAAVKGAGVSEVYLSFAPDDEKKTLLAFRKALKSSDIILFTGGISVGDYDFVGKVLAGEKVKNVFYKVKQKPGKPLYFGVKNKKYIFGLPGNPASVLTCFYEYVLPAIRKFSGCGNCFLPALHLPIAKTIRKKSGLIHFLKGVTDYKSVTPLDGQESYIMRSYAAANCLLVFPEEAEQISAGEIAEVHLF
jgi:molybdopterin molybdotransferase